MNFALICGFALQCVSHADLQSKEGRFQGHLSRWPLGTRSQGENRRINIHRVWHELCLTYILWTFICSGVRSYFFLFTRVSNVCKSLNSTCSNTPAKVDLRERVRNGRNNRNKTEKCFRLENEISKYTIVFILKWNFGCRLSLRRPA